MTRPNRIKEYIFSSSEITASSAGRFEAFSNHALNGTIQTITMYSNTFATGGSLLFFESGLPNSGTNIDGMFAKIQAGSTNQTFSPVTYANYITGETGSPSILTQMIIQGPLRLIGSGLGNGTSGDYIRVRYI